MKKIEEKLDKIVRRLKDYPLTTLLITFLLIFLLPILLTQTFSWVDFSKTGTIGDTIGGITTPFISVMAAILVYYSFRQQIIANKILADQRQDDRKYDNKN